MTTTTTIRSSSGSELSTLTTSNNGESEEEERLEIKDVVRVLGQKRGRESGVSNSDSVISGGKKNKKAKVGNGPVDAGDGEEGDKTKGVYCHNCRRLCSPDAFLRCTKLKQKRGKASPIAPCNLAFCDRDLINRYGISPQAIRWEGRSASNEGEHDKDAGYQFTCPCCLDQCQTSSCRKKKGLEPLGNLGKEAKAVGAANTAALLERRPPVKNHIKTIGHNPITPNGKSTPAKSVIINFLDDDSDLSDPDSDSLENATTPKSKRPPKARKDEKKVGRESSVKGTPKTVQTVKKKPEAKGTLKNGKENKTTAKITKDGKSSAKSANAVKGTPKKTVKEEKVKVKASTTKKEKESEMKAVKPQTAKKVSVMPVLPPPEPPVFEKVDTKLSREEAEQRIMLREYLLRFRPVLSVPERSLPAVDDFDRPLTEASVRLFAGAMLDMIKDELEHSGNEDDEGVAEMMFNLREELRYYADLARFAAIFNIISEPLRLRLPPPIVDTRAQTNDSALRALLDLDENQPSPAWAAELSAGPSRRVGASRIPQPAEVVRMLLALAERTLATPKIRYEMEMFSLEYKERMKQYNEVKGHTAVFEAKKKKLAEARVRCKSAAETKANKEMLHGEEREYGELVKLLNVNLRATLGRIALRHEPLGRDVDGRIYYALTPRHVNSDGRPPSGWASGLLVWGIGVPGKTDQGDDLPVSTERWNHFGKSKDVTQLIKYVEWKYEQAAEAVRASKKKVKAKPTPKSTPAKATPAKGKGKATPGKSTPRQKTLLEVVIPVSKKSASGSGSPLSSLEPVKKEDDASSTSSALTPPPTAFKEELLSHLDPKGYTPSAETIEEEGKKLVLNLRDVGQWLEVLEAQGMGEPE
ncbi:hypothetical protein IAR55_001825 [Kwoniella newhampshirensis]|uniref:Zinc-finger domain-containing protein n=1 Tax=Kwoniella newhampshirensis TaxID=1651941 RepID=A0AAW0Z3A1_9TREE